MITFKEYLEERFKIPYDIEDLWEQSSEVQDKLLQSFFGGDVHNPGRHIPWHTVPYQTLKRIWQTFAHKHTLSYSEERILDQIAATIIENVLKIQAITMFYGHTQLDPDEILESHGYPTTEEMDEDVENNFYEYFEPEGKPPAYSDYGLDILLKHVAEYIEANTDAEKIMALDRLLQVTHMRGDLAELFVEGGTDALTNLFLT